MSESGKRHPLFYLIGVIAIPISVFAFIRLYNNSFTVDMYQQQYRYNVKTEYVRIYWTPGSMDKTQAAITAGHIARSLNDITEENKKGKLDTSNYKGGVYIFSLVSENSDELYESIKDTIARYEELNGALVRIEYDRNNIPPVEFKFEKPKTQNE